MESLGISTIIIDNMVIYKEFKESLRSKGELEI